jgi:hypothetical protein
MVAALAFKGPASAEGAWTPEPPPVNGDGRAFTSQDGAQLTVSGSPVSYVVTNTFAAYKAWLLENAELDSITYKAEGKTWLVLCGMKGQTSSIIRPWKAAARRIHFTSSTRRPRRNSTTPLQHELLVHLVVKLDPYGAGDLPTGECSCADNASFPNRNLLAKVSSSAGPLI